MNKHDAYKTLILEFKAVSPSITEAQRKGLLRRGIEEHGLSVDEAINRQYHRISLCEIY